MKAIGIVRRIDDLWRIVIPKEIRRTLKIREHLYSLKTRFICFGFEKAVKYIKMGTNIFD